MRGLALVLLISFVAIPQLEGQERIAVSSEEAAAHLIKKVDPVYPAFDKAAGIRGTVRVHVVIGVDGRVKDMPIGLSEPLHPLLDQSARNAVVQYVWHPFEKNGQPASAETDVGVTFGLPQNVAAPPAPPLLSSALFKSFFWNGGFSSSGFLSGLACPECLATVPSDLRNWIAKRLEKQINEATGGNPSYSSGFSSVEADLRDQKASLPRAIQIVQVAEKKDIGMHVYLYRTDLPEFCGDGNCEIDLVEQDAGSIRKLVETDGWGYFVNYRGLSTYPDVFIVRHMSAAETDVVGYAYANGLWGPLYCGKIILSSEQGPDESKEQETDYLHVCG